MQRDPKARWLIVGLVVAGAGCSGEAALPSVAVSTASDGLEAGTWEALLRDEGVWLVPSPDSQTFNELAFRWTANSALKGTKVASKPAVRASKLENGDLTLLDSRQTGAVKRRAHALGADEIALVALDSLGRGLGHAVIADPRVVIFEEADAAGALQGEKRIATHVEFVAALPADPGTVEIRIYTADEEAKPTAHLLGKAVVQ